MNSPLTPQFISSLTLELRSYITLCEEILGLITQENKALAGQATYNHFDFYQKRKNLLPNIDLLLAKLRSRRLIWQQIPTAERERCTEVKPLFENIQNLLMKVLLLDRENQQIMLRRGLVPATHVPAAPAPRPNYVANVYQRNFPGRG